MHGADKFIGALIVILRSFGKAPALMDTNNMQLQYTLMAASSD